MQHATTASRESPTTGHNATPLLRKKHAVFILRHTSVRMWHKAFLRWALLQGQSPHMSDSSKNAMDPVSIPLFRPPQRRVINPTPLKRVKALGDGPLRPEVLYPVVEHTNHAARNHSRSGALHHWTQSNATLEKNAPLFILRPSSVRIWHKAVFKVGQIVDIKGTL